MRFATMGRDINVVTKKKSSTTKKIWCCGALLRRPKQSKNTLSNYKVMASVGHIRDLKSTMSGLTSTITMNQVCGKGPLINDLKKKLCQTSLSRKTGPRRWEKLFLAFAYFELDAKEKKLWSLTKLPKMPLKCL